MSNLIRVSFDFLIESELGIENANYTFSVDGQAFANASQIEKMKVAMSEMRKHRPFPTYHVINISQTVLEGVPNPQRDQAMQ